MNSLSKAEIVSLGLMLFSIFFGAGNLIFPPALGQSAGTNFTPAIIGFLITGVGLPLMGVLSVALMGDKSYSRGLSERINPTLVTILLATLYLTIGPLFAVPRTGAVAFEIGIKAFLQPADFTTGQLIYTLIFFALTYYLALNPLKIVDRIGKLLTPLLLFFLVLLLGKAFISPLGVPLEAVGNYVDAPFLQGFQDGYLTMDLLASTAFGTIVAKAVHDKGVTQPLAITKICATAGVIAIALMSAVYVSLGYLGATSTNVLGHCENGGIILTNAAFIYFGYTGNIILAAIISFACLTTSSGLVSACSVFFTGLCRGKVTYRQFVLIFSVFSLAAANFGLTELIAFSIPFLITIYPVMIVLVILSLLNPLFNGKREVYLYSLGLTLLFSIVGGLQAANIPIGTIDELFKLYLPLYQSNLGWVCPALAGIICGLIHSAIRPAPAIK